MEWIVAKLGVSAVQYTVGGLGAVAIAWVLKKIPNKTLKAKFGSLMYGLGVASTLGLGKWTVTKKFWNSTVEPWFIDLIDNVFGSMVRGFIKGLRSDN